MSDTEPRYLDRGDGTRLAYYALPGASPGVVFLGGFMSDMTGTKAMALDAWCRRRGQAYVRFDYLGHGASSGRFEEGTIGRWAADAIAVVDTVTRGPQILVGSSMGGWIMLLAALARQERVGALVGIAAAPDFTEDLLWERFDAAERAAIERDGVLRQPSDYSDEPYPITRRLIEEGRDHLLLRAPIVLDCPVRLLQGMQDADVPWQTAIRLAEALTSRDVAVTLVKAGDHRLSEPEDIVRLEATLDALSGSSD